MIAFCFLRLIACDSRAANGLDISDGTEATGGEGSVFGWYIDQIVDTVYGELGKRPVLWSPLNWNIERRYRSKLPLVIHFYICQSFLTD